MKKPQTIEDAANAVWGAMTKEQRADMRSVEVPVPHEVEMEALYRLSPEEVFGPEVVRTAGTARRR